MADLPVEFANGIVLGQSLVKPHRSVPNAIRQHLQSPFLIFHALDHVFAVIVPLFALSIDFE